MPKEKIECPECGRVFAVQLDDRKEVNLTQKCPRCDYLIDYIRIVQQRKIEEINAEQGDAIRSMMAERRPRFRRTPLPEVGVSPEEGESVDLEYENVPLSKRVSPKKPKKRGDKE